jgi:Undecaprenyl-phosphate galactose phosphotransferase WbaP
MSERITASETELQAVARNYALRTRTLRHWLTVFCLVSADAAAFFTAAILFRFGRPVPLLYFYHSLLPLDSPIDLYFVLGFLFVIVRFVVGDYSRRQLFWDGARLTTISLLITASPSMMLLIFAPIANYSVYAELCSWTFVIVAVPVFRQGARWLMNRLSVWQLQTALIGDGPNALEAFDAFSKSLALGFDVRFLITLGDMHEDEEDFSGVTRIGLRDPSNIARRLVEAGCLQVVVATEEQLDDGTDGLIQRLLASGLSVAIIPPLKRLPLLGLSTNYFFGRDLLLLQVRNNLSRLPSRAFKRLMDFLGSIVLLLLLLPFFAIIALAVKRCDGGPVFFVQRRVGRNGEEFDCVKFRTMALDAEDQLSRWKQEKSPYYEEYVRSNFKLRDDPRVTRVGRFLRRTSLDELPQLINVVSGEMSLVGPRPLLSREIGEYGVTFKLYQQVHPGMTGLWQISGRSHTTFADRVASDDWYIKNWSFWYDIVILLQTAWVLAKRDGAY